MLRVTIGAILGVLMLGPIAHSQMLPPAALPPRSAPPSVMRAQGQPIPSIARQQAIAAQLRRDRQTRLALPVFVKVVAPEKSKVIFFSAGGVPHLYDASVKVGLRARHRYAFALERLPGFENLRFYGTIDVVRGPELPTDVKGSDVPVPLRFDEEDVSALVSERMLTKIFVLEDPEKALPQPSKGDEPPRYQAGQGDNPVKMAKGLGEIVLAVRIGTRVPSDEELTGSTAPGSLLIPKFVARKLNDGTELPAAETFIYADTDSTSPFQQVDHATISDNASCPPAACLIPTRPDLVPVPPARQMRKNMGPAASLAGPVGPGLAAQLPDLYEQSFDEYLCDGGDMRPKVGRNQLGDLVNVDPSDTVAEYQVPSGKRKYAESNRVCVFAPRYVEVRQQSTAEGYIARQLAGIVDREDSQIENIGLVASAERVRVANPQATRMRQRASGLVGEQWTGNFGEVRVLAGFDQRIGWAALLETDMAKTLIGDVQPMLAKRVDLAQKLTQVQYPQIVGMLQGTSEVRATWKAQESVVYEPRPLKPGRLLLEKSASRPNADIGDIIGFTIKYTNTGEETIENIAIVDSLLSRLEYIPESALSDRDAVFTTQDNEVGSATLRWEIKTPLKGGESGMVFFKTRVR